MTDETKVVEVAAAVMLRAEGQEFLLGQRPPGKVYAGYWEFPGGKVEPGETVRDALIRELYEELGITVTGCSPWLTRCFVYPHAHVRLNFWRVTAWSGDIGEALPLEHSAVNWQSCQKAAEVAPILPANDPILKALSLPTTMAITQAAVHGIEAELARLEVAMAQGVRLIQIREKGWPGTEAFAREVKQRAAKWQAVVVLNSEASLAQTLGLGLHLTASELQACARRPDLPWVGASCHTAEELARAGELGLDYALLGPVLPTATHPDSAGLGWAKFADVLAGNTLPVFALGGMQKTHLAQAQQLGAHGIAMMRGW